MIYYSVAIVGATASGKTEIAVKIGLNLRKHGVDVEFISCDSRKVYKNFDIGTAKPVKYLNEFKWHFISIKEPNERFSAKEFEVLGRKLIEEIKMKGKIPIIVGGTWLYIRALEKGFFSEKEDKELREKLENILNKEGKQKLVDMLKEIDPKALEKIHINDTYRIIRAIEVKLKTGKSITEMHFGEYFPIAKFGIYRSRADIKERIRRRVLKQIEQGLVDEIKEALEKYGEVVPLLKSIACYEPYLYIKGKISFDEMISLMVSHNFRYARYQFKVFSREGTTWFSSEDQLVSFISDFLLEKGIS